MATTQSTDAVAAKAGKRRKRPRIRPLPPAVNLRNLAIEKERRQDLNATLLGLARCLPALASAKRISKRLIMTESLNHIRRQRDTCVAAGRELQELLPAYNRLIAEVNSLRAQLRIPIRNAPVQWSPALLSIMEVEHHKCGEFPDGFANSGDPTESETSQLSTPQSGEEAALSFDLSDLPVLVSPAPMPIDRMPGPDFHFAAGDAFSTIWQLSAPEPFLPTCNVTDLFKSRENWSDLHALELSAGGQWEGLQTRDAPLDRTFI